MSGSYCGIRIWFYLIMVAGAVLFFVTRVMAAGSPSPGLKVEDCDWFSQTDQQIIETAARSMDRHTGELPRQEGLGGGGAPADLLNRDRATRDRATGDRATGNKARFWELAAASGECPADDTN